METKFSDVAHLYLGCEITIGDKDITGFIEMVSSQSICTGTNSKNIPMWFKSSACLPILRPLSDMQQGELDHLNFLVRHTGNVYDKESVKGWRPEYLYFSMEVFAVMLKQGFDLFALIESGQAIDKTKI